MIAALIKETSESGGEGTLGQVVDSFVMVVEGAGALVIFLGAVIGIARFLYVGVVKRKTSAFVPIRLDLGRFLALGLEFQLAGDILRTAIAPTFRELGELAIVAALRTGLNFFLGREIREEKEEIEAEEEAKELLEAHGAKP